MRGLIALSLLICLGGVLKAESDTAYAFTTIKDLPATSVKDQHRSGTCWSFSGISFVESEILRKGGPELDLSEMYVVRNCYAFKAERFVRMHGETNFAAGGAFYDVFWVLKNYGLVPEDSYPGLNYGEDQHVHGELDNVLKSFVTAVEQNKNRKLSTAWMPAVNGILDAYFGSVPENVIIDGETMSVKDFNNKVINVNAEDYISITSYTHHPFYETFILEIPDNWLWTESYNVPLEELAEICRSAVENGYTIAWGGDVSEKGFSHKKGLAIVPDEISKDMTDSERSKWEGLPQSDKDRKLYKFDAPVVEKEITQEMRQEQFDNYLTTDDHGMHITGMVKDQNGTIYYKVKNSWNTDNKYDGYLYMSEPYVKLKTMNIIVHKDAVPKRIRKKFNL